LRHRKRPSFFGGSGLTERFRQWEYETKLRGWGFTKNLKKKDWPAIDHHVSKRKRDGKESEVLLNDIPIPPKKIQKETSRYRGAFTSDYGDEGKKSSTDLTRDCRLKVY
jgi:hypothetical protein